jgi:NAD(P)-dependent dehydrogenase (short-subunit alcohol dehydrogenase family)
VDEFRLDGYVALITGAGRGIGAGIARAFALAGADVALVARTASELEEVAAGIRAAGRSSSIISSNLTDVSRAARIVERTVAEHGRLDILVNNAGTNPYFGPMIDIDVARAQKTFEVNQLSVLVWTAAAVKAGLRGSVINMASIGGLEVEPGIGWYNVTKAAVLHITRQLSFELAPDVRVNALAPGLVKTKLAAALWEGPGEDRIAAHVPLRRLGLPDDIATAALFLASDAASWVTGQTFVVDGGTTAQPSGGVG